MAEVIVQHLGKKGVRGQDGSDGLSIGNINGYKLDNPKLLAFQRNKISASVTWSRSTEATIQSIYDEQQTVDKAQNAQFLNWSNDITTSGGKWLDSNSNWARTATGVTDPFGGTLAQEITFTDNTGQLDVLQGFPSGISLGKTYTVSFYAQLVSGTIDSARAAISGTDYAGANSFDLTSLDGTWRRFVTRITTISGTGFFRLDFRTTGAVLNLYEVNITEGISLYDPVNALADAPKTFNTGSLIYRANENGYLIEPESTNICQYSEDLSQWQVTGATVGNNPAFDSLAVGGSNTRLSFTGSTVVASLSNIGVTEGVEYSVSYFAVVQSGSVDSIGVSLGDGETVTATTTSSYTRQFIKATCGTGDSIRFTLTSSEGTTTTVDLVAIQVEQSEPTGYIPTATEDKTRASDNVSMDTGYLPSLAQPFTVQVTWNRVYQNALTKYLFNFGGSFSARINAANLIVEGGGVDIATIPLTTPTSHEAFLVFNGTQMLIYIDRVLATTVSYSGETSKPSTGYIGSIDGAGANSINGFIGALNFWPYAVGADDITFMSGVYNGTLG